jgi:cytoskeletal protein RodZ
MSASLSHPTLIRNLIADTVVDQLDAGGAAAKLIFYTANGGSALATLTFAEPAFNGAASGTAAVTTDSIVSNTNTNAGTVTWFEAQDSNGNTIFEGNVSSDDDANGSIQLSSTTLGTGDTVSVSALSYTAPA